MMSYLMFYQGDADVYRVEIQFSSLFAVLSLHQSIMP